MARSQWLGVLCIVASTTLPLVCGAAHAQIVERNLPPAPPPQGGAVRGAPDLLRTDDPTPIGPDLKAVVILGAHDTAGGGRAAAGIDVRRADPAFAAAIQAQLAPNLGQRLSRKLIADIQAGVAEVYRGAGRPFVSVTVPPQEVTSGVLHVRVVEARLGRVGVTGAGPERERLILDRVRLVPGQPIDARRLEADLEGLNRGPFTRVEAVFGPGKDLGLTDLTLQVSEGKPWQVFAGYANTGTQLTDRDRIFAGAVGAFADVIASYQITGSKDFWGDGSRAFPGAGEAKYVSHAGRVDIPLWWRASLELTGNYVLTNERPNGFSRFRTETTEVAPMIRVPFINPLLPAGSVMAGAEFKRQRRTTYLTGVEVGTAEAAVFQAVTGWAGAWSDRYGANNLDLRVKYNPGGVLADNTAAAWSAFTNGRVTDPQTTQLALLYNRTTPLPAGMTLATEVIVLESDKPLPDTERLALGGASTVRGYVSEDGNVDRAAVLRNSLYFPGLGLTNAPAGAAFWDRISPFVFADVGHGRDNFTAATTNLASVGAGFDQQIASYLRSNLTAGYALRDGAQTGAGSWHLHVRVVASY